MASHSQQETLSLRIGSALRQRLTGIQRRAASRVGRTPSLSDVAKRLLASVRGPEVEVAEMLAEPTRVLLTVRRKRAAGLPLTQAEWIVVLHFVQQGMETTLAGLSPVTVSMTLSVLDAFLALHVQRARQSALDELYLHNLPAECRSSWLGSGRVVITDPALHVHETVAATRRRLAEGETSLRPLRAARNLHVLVANDDTAGGEAINQALSPHWSSLWALAARGHYAMTERPVRGGASSEWFFDRPFPLMLRDGGVAVSCVYGPELCVSVTFPGAVGVLYPLSQYPILREFRVMISALGASANRFEGVFFHGDVGGADGCIWFRALSNGVSVGCQLEDWERLRGLFLQMWETADIQREWERLADEYGEV